ncbi:cold shock-like protein [Yersinia frederiksenii]|uniref:Cold shock-like protein CspB n=2 Tax=Yersinia frederiksenii TaxID=29484 RepID=A0A380PRD2_YERFR|nr:cold shock-like protein CspD [Yersinia frederiksenii]ATM95264.1 cold shock domain protein CspD [Yersinia frederiksenii]EEQ13842.1 Cold shock-like protein cspD [Yersinia frederiksenii ATCC 33641]KGA47730.1 cold shock domain protein CspD [Yersinia frederiksenii ATCC 33641]CNB58949.1 cold shock-like protein [Yersinia frederiksenii]SUP76166.1 cold shock-like protein [Yersinia frederiksenii]
METGTVKWFNNAKGFGFICPEGGGEDIFAHYSTIQMDGYRTLKAGQMVNFDVHQGPKGNHASLIVPLELDVILQEAVPQELAALA